VDHNVSKGSNWEGLDFNDTVLNVKDTKIFAETVLAETAFIYAISENSVSSSQCSDLKQEKFKSNFQHTDDSKFGETGISCKKVPSGRVGGLHSKHPCGLLGRGNIVSFLKILFYLVYSCNKEKIKTKIILVSKLNMNSRMI